MSSYVELHPTAHATKVTEVVRIDNDFSLTVTVNDDGTRTTSYYNLQGIPDDYLYKPSPADDNLIQSQLVKDGADESLTSRIRMFYNENDDTLEDYQIPRAWVYSAPIDKNNFLPGSELPSTLTQEFPIIVWDTLPDSQPAPPANTVSAIVFDSLYTRLDNLEDRRRRLKNDLRVRFEDPTVMAMMMGTHLPVINADSDSLSGLTEVSDIDFTVTQQHAHSRRLQGWVFRIEMLARAVSADANLSNERKFNLLHGEINLGNSDLFQKIELGLNAKIASGATRADWSFVRLGSSASSSPYKYTAPLTSLTSWTGTADTLINVGSAPSTDFNWTEWLRE